MINLFYKKITPDAKLFTYSKYGDARLDIYSNEELILRLDETRVVKTGIALEIPLHYEGIVVGRSGLTSQGLVVHQGIIDSNYRGEIGVIISNFSDEFYRIYKGDRIAQFTIREVPTITFTEVDELSDSNRGEQGFGSSGR